MTFEEIVQEIPKLPLDQRKLLINVLVDSLVESASRTRSILEFEGIGESLRDDMDAQDYVNQLRDEWNH